MEQPIASTPTQETWIRWRGRKAEVENPRSYLLTITARLCLTELDSAHARHEEPRMSLPEPIELEDDTTGLEVMEQVSMAFLVALQCLKPAERAVLVLHDVFDLSHAEIGALVGRTEAGTRQLLKRARDGVTARRIVTLASHDEHRRLLGAFQSAVRSGDISAVTALLADDATLITDGGPAGVRVGRVRNLPGPLVGADKIAAFVIAAGPQAAPDDTREFMLNGQPALVGFRDGRPFAAVFLAIADGKIVQIFIQADPVRLHRIA